MTLPFTFANLPAGNNPASDLDANFNALGNFVPIQCTASGVTTITLTPVTNSPALSAYQTLQAVTFVAVGTNGTPATVNLAGLGAKPLRINLGLSINELPGGLFGNGDLIFAIYDGTQFIVFLPRITGIAPKISILTTTSVSPYFVPSGALYLLVEMCAGGGGTGGNGGAGASAGGNGGNTTFGTAFLACNGGIGTVANAINAGVAGAMSTGGDLNLPGGQGWSALENTIVGQLAGGAGGNTPFFGGGGPGSPSGSVGFPGIPGTGGGAGGPAGNTGVQEGAGAGSGSYLRKIIASPDASYAFVIGAGGAAGAAGAGGQPGGKGGDGSIIVTAFFN